MANQLTRDEWYEVKPPFYWVKVRNVDLSQTNFDMVEKWLHNKCEGWWYRDDKTFIFELSSDLITLKMWLASEPFSGDHGDI